MQLLFGIIVLGGFAISGIPAQHHAGGTVMCLGCNGIKDPRDCTTVAKCHHEEQCYTEVNIINGETLYNLGCKPRHECDHLTMPVGRRLARSPCQECCHGLACNRDLCASFMPAKTTMASVTTASQDTCRDHEEDGFSCTSYDVYNFCTDTTGFAFVIAHQKCPKHCGFCGGSGSNSATTVSMDTTTMPDSTTTTAAATNAPTTTVGGASVVIGESTTYKPMLPSATPDTKNNVCSKTCLQRPPKYIIQFCVEGVCEDKEDGTFKCSEHMDLCLDSSFYAVQLAKDRCPKYCGLCDTQSTTASPVTMV